MKKHRYLKIGTCAALALMQIGMLAGAGISPSRLEALRTAAAGDPAAPLLIDLREAAAYRQATIPGAMNIPSPFIAQRRLPTGRQIVVFGDGLGRVDARAVAQAMAARMGVEVHWLEGGYAAWQQARGEDTAAAGLSAEALAHISYRQLSESAMTDAVLYDLRPQPSGLQPMGADDPVAEFAAAHGFGHARGDPLNAIGGAAAGQLAPASTPPLIVLVDDDAARAEAMARTLRANGHERVVILAGGVEILRHAGRSGKVRRSTGIEVEIGVEDFQ